MKHLHLFAISFFLCFNFFVFTTYVNALDLEDLSKYSKIKSYCEIKNINNIPLSVKIEQMLFLNWDFNKLNQSELLDYLKYHYIGGISLSVDNLENNQENLKQFIVSMKSLYALPSFYTIPHFISINSNDFLNTKDEFTEHKNINIIHSLGANIININSGESFYTKSNIEKYKILFNYLKKSNSTGTIVAISKFRDPFLNNNQVNVYGWLIKKGNFDQIIVPENYNDPTIDKHHYYSLSKKALEENIKNKLTFKGIILNTSLESNTMKNKYTINQIIVNSITSGNNMLYYNGKTIEDNKKFVDQVIKTVTKAINDGIISINDIDESYIKILNLKNQFCITPRKNYC